MGPASMVIPDQITTHITSCLPLPFVLLLFFFVGNMVQYTLPFLVLYISHLCFPSSFCCYASDPALFQPSCAIHHASNRTLPVIQADVLFGRAISHMLSVMDPSFKCSAFASANHAISCMLSVVQVAVLDYTIGHTPSVVLLSFFPLANTATNSPLLPQAVLSICTSF